MTQVPNNIVIKSFGYLVDQLSAQTFDLFKQEGPGLSDGFYLCFHDSDVCYF